MNPAYKRCALRSRLYLSNKYIFIENTLTVCKIKVHARKCDYPTLKRISFQIMYDHNLYAPLQNMRLNGGKLDILNVVDGRALDSWFQVEIGFTGKVENMYDKRAIGVIENWKFRIKMDWLSEKFCTCAKFSSVPFKCQLIYSTW